MKKGSFSKGVVALIILMNIIFTAATLIVFAMTGAEPVALIGAWFGFTTGELWLLSGIKKEKLKKTDECFRTLDEMKETYGGTEDEKG